MSIRSALVGSVLLVALLAVAIIAFLGVRSIQQSVVQQAQGVVTQSLQSAFSYYKDSLTHPMHQLKNAASRFSVDSPRELLEKQLIEEKQRLGFAVLNLCDVEGQPLAGAYPSLDIMLPISKDSVLRQALSGKSAYGTVSFDSSRLELEGGAALRNAVRLPVAHDDLEPSPGALFQWFAEPLKDASGRVLALLYGGRIINNNHELVDKLRNGSFGHELYRGKPRGTVTFFRGPIRVATNVIHDRGERALGTRVSEEVRQAVLVEGREWHSRAWVVDAWYLSAYRPLQDPDGKSIGMFYVGLLETPYQDLESKLLIRFLLPVAVVLLLALVGAGVIVKNISRPLRHLQDNAEQLAQGDWDVDSFEGGTYRELHELGQAFRTMRDAIKERDERLHQKNETLIETNEQLERINQNYMTTLRFVTHELKAPLAAMQGFVDLLVGSTLGEMPEKSKPILVRVKRNCEELQDMVKNYLDLARAERGELEAHKEEIDFVRDVMEPCIFQCRPLFDSRSIALEKNAPEKLMLSADPELLRIALNNYLSNAAKYGREGGRARLDVSSRDGEIIATVWNEGEGFSTEESKKLFNKFSRLNNKNTKDKRGSGLGLFLCKQVLELHQGSVSAKSEKGAWAEFSMRFPLRG